MNEVAGRCGLLSYDEEVGRQPAEDVGAVLKACDFEGVKGLTINTKEVVDRDHAVFGAEQAEPEFGAGRRMDYIGLVVPIVLESQAVTESSSWRRGQAVAVAARVLAGDELLDAGHEVGGRDDEARIRAVDLEVADADHFAGIGDKGAAALPADSC